MQNAIRALKDTVCMGLNFIYTVSLTPYIDPMLKGLMSLFAEEKAKLKVMR